MQHEASFAESIAYPAIERDTAAHGNKTAASVKRESYPLFYPQNSILLRPWRMRLLLPRCAKTGGRGETFPNQPERQFQMSDKPENAEPDTNTPTPIVLGRLELSPQRIEPTIERATFIALHVVPPDQLAAVLRGEHVDPTSPKTGECEVKRG